MLTCHILFCIFSICVTSIYYFNPIPTISIPHWLPQQQLLDSLTRDLSFYSPKFQSLINSTMGNALRFLYSNCCKPTAAGDSDSLGPHGVSSATVGVSALAHDLFHFENTSQVHILLLLKLLNYALTACVILIMFSQLIIVNLVEGM